MRQFHMSVFEKYARYYHLLYRDKDYAGEVKFVHHLLQSQAPTARSLLELGCGTGAHAVLLAREGYEVHGIDQSAEMLEQAQQRILTLSPAHKSKLQFSQGDIRTVRLQRKFDAVISLFHVFSYQVTNEDLQSAFATAKAHLHPGGILIFDCWYGPAVLTERPTIRVKRLEDEDIIVTRIAQPKMHANDNVVDVNYQVFIKKIDTNSFEELQETHRMRYLFKPEVEYFLSQNQMILNQWGEWMTGKEPGFDTWSVYFLASLQIE